MLKKLNWTWWLVFTLAALPSAVLLGLYFFNPRALGIDAAEVVLQESGEWTLRFLLITLACSPLRRLGFKKAVRFRRMLGLFTFYYASIHLSIYIGGWIQWDWSTFLQDILDRPFIYLGMLGWVILFVLAITSPKFVVKKLKKHWSTLHKLVYPALALGWLHLFIQSRGSFSEATV